MKRAPRLSDLKPIDDETDCINVVVETSRDSRTKLAYDPDRDAFVVKKVLPQGMIFPFDFGFIPSTKGGDGDPLDVLVPMEEAMPPGTIVPARLIGVIEAIQTEEGESETNDRLIAVAEAHEIFSDVKQLSDLPESIVAQIEEFFVNYNQQSGKTFEPKGRHGKRRATKILEKGRRKYQRSSR